MTAPTPAAAPLTYKVTQEQLRELAFALVRALGAAWPCDAAGAIDWLARASNIVSEIENGGPLAK